MKQICSKAIVGQQVKKLTFYGYGKFTAINDLKLAEHISLRYTEPITAGS
jgi:hypothetical protein